MGKNGHNKMFDQYEYMWSKELKFILNYNLKENFYKMIYLWS